MALDALVDLFLPQSEKNVGLKGLNQHTTEIKAITRVIVIL